MRWDHIAIPAILVALLVSMLWYTFYVPETHASKTPKIGYVSNQASSTTAKEETMPCKYDAGNIESYHEIIRKAFGLGSNQYEIRCVRSDMSRGGFIEAQGRLSTGGNFELYYHWGWCSSSGTDCGWAKCFSVEGNDRLFEIVRNRICNEITSRTAHGEFCPSQAYDNTEEAREKCLNGGYDYLIGSRKIISIVQHSGRCSSYVEKGIPDCSGI